MYSFTFSCGKKKEKSYKYRENTVLLPEQCRLSGWGERHEIGAAPSLEALNLI